MNSLVAVSVIIPCRNERRFIGACLESILAGDYPTGQMEILVADGMSDDGTRKILEQYGSRHSNIRIIDNPGKVVPTGMNLAIEAAGGAIIVRMDAHTEYAPDYIRRCVAVLQETGADNVGGAMRTRASGFIQQAVSLAFHSPFSVGGASFHNVDHEGYVDTVPYGCWYRAKLIELGLFDEELVRNQDDELNLRIVRQGGRIWQSSLIRSWYQPRPSLLALFKQQYQYGYWKVRVIQKHKLPASWRHLIPGAWVGSLVCLVALAPFWVVARWLLATSVTLYGLASLAATFSACRRSENFKFIPIIPVVFAMYHVGYGVGFLHGLLDFALLPRGRRGLSGKITTDKVR